ncbi:WD40 repeat domain-containing protein, partial [Candidatus Babeliales bacterium]|nr:WD40 repeat domain-containing protein [Candidatus Babeliales bacterium]
MVKKNWIFILIICSLLNTVQVSCVVIGSDTVVSRESAITFPSADIDNEIRGFAWMDNGFTLSNVATTCTFNAVFPVKGDVGLNGGTLYLNEDLCFKNDSSLTSVGNIYGNNHQVTFCSSINEIDFSGSVNGAKIVNLVDRVARGDTIFDVDWSHDNQYLAIGMASPSAGVDIFYFDGTSLTLTASAQFLLSNNESVATVEWHPQDHYLVVGQYKNPGDELHVYRLDTSNGTFYETDSEGTPNDHALSFAWTPSGNYLATGYSTNINKISVYPFLAGELDYSSKILANTMPDENVWLSTMDWDTTGSYLAVGTEAAAGGTELLIYHFDGASLTLTVSAEIGEGVGEVEWSPTGTFILVGLTSGSERLRVYRHTVSNGTLCEEISARPGISETVWAADWKPDGSQILMGSFVSAAETEFRIYDFYENTMTMSLANQIGASSDITAVKWSSDGECFARVGYSQNLEVFNLSASFLLENVRLVFDSDITVRTPISFQGNCSIDTRGNKLLIENAASLEIRSDSTLSFENSRIRSTNDNPISPVDSTSMVSFKDTKLDLCSDIIFDSGIVNVDGYLDVSGSHTFFYNTAQTMTIEKFSRLKFQDGAVLQLSRSSTSDKQQLAFIDQTSRFVLNNGVLHVTDSGAQLTNGLIEIERRSAFSIDSSDYTYGLSIGNGIEQDDPIIQVGPGAELSISSGALSMSQYSSEKIILSGGNSRFNLGSDLSVNILGQLHYSRGELKFSPLTQTDFADGTYLQATNLRMILNGISDIELTGTFENEVSLILDKDDSVNVLSGILSYLITVSQTGNIICGAGDCNSNIVLSDSNATLSWALNGKVNKFDLVPEYGQHMVLNGGILELNSDLEFSGDYKILDSGRVNLQGNRLLFGPQDTAWTGSIYWDGDDGFINLNAKVALEGIWTFSQNITINGNGNELDLGSTGSIVVERGSILKFKNITINGLSSERISCADDDGVITFDNTKICLYGDYAFKTGSMQINNDVIIRNGHNVADAVWTFSYESHQASTIFQNSELQLRRNVRFEIGRWQENTVSNRIEPLEFIDKTSFLHLNQCEFKVTGSGMILKKGKVLVSRASVLDIASTASEDALAFGTGSAADDVYIEIGGDAELCINGGTAFYNNSEEDGITFITEASGIRFGAQGNLTAQSTMLLRNGRLYIPAGGHMGVLGSAILKQDGMFHKHSAPYSEHLVKFERRSGQPGGVFQDGDYFMVSQGASVLPLRFEQGTGRIGGPALISAPITLQDSNVTVNIALTAGLNADIILNGGTIVLDNDLEFVGDHSVTGSGRVVLNDRKYSFGTTEFNFTDTVVWDMSSQIELSSKLNLSGMWMFSGNG